MRVVRASSPDDLAFVIRSIKVPMEVVSFGQDAESYFAYYRTDRGMERRVMMDIQKSLRDISRGGEAPT